MVSTIENRGFLLFMAGSRNPETRKNVLNKYFPQIIIYNLFVRVYSFGCMVTIIIINLHEIELVYRVWLQEVGRRVGSHRLLLVFYK